MAYHRTAVFKVRDRSGQKLRRLQKMQRRYSSAYPAILWSQAAPTPPWVWRDRGGGEVADKDCNDFRTHSEAQAFFERHQPGEPHNLDRDGVACESLQ